MLPIIKHPVFLLLLASLLLLQLCHASPAELPPSKPKQAPAGFKYPTPKDSPARRKKSIPKDRHGRLLLYPASKKKGGRPVGCLRTDGKAFFPRGLGSLAHCEVFTFRSSGQLETHRSGVLTISQGGSCAIAPRTRELVCREGDVKLATGPGEFLSRPYGLDWGYRADANPYNGRDGDRGDLKIVGYWHVDREPKKNGEPATLYALPDGLSTKGRGEKYSLRWSS